MKVGILINADRNVAERMRHYRELGFTGAQLSVWDMDFYTRENARMVMQTAQDIGMRISAVWAGWTGPMDWGYPGMYRSLGLVPDWLRDRRLAELRKGGEFADSIGVDTIVTHTGYLPDDPLHPTHLAIADSLKYLCRELDGRGQKFAFETGEELPLTLANLICEIGLDNVGVNFDPANLMINGRGNPIDAMQLLKTRIFGMHAKDGVYPVFGTPKGHETPIGQGSVDFKALIQILRKIGYQGDITIEREIPEGDARDIDVVAGKKMLESIICNPE